MTQRQVRHLLRMAHRWISLILGLPIALIAASGAAVDYWFEIDAWAAPAFYQGRDSGPPLPLDRLAAAAHRARPDCRIENIFLNQDGRVAIISLIGPQGERIRDVAIDRASGAVLGQRWQDEALINQLYAFHTRLLLGEGARSLVLASAIMFVGLLASGLFLWWPNASRWRAALSFRLLRKAWLLDLHAKLGIYSLALTAVAGVTAIIMLWPASDVPPSAVAQGATPARGRQPLQAQVNAIITGNPGWQAVNLLDPERQGVPMRVILWRLGGLVQEERTRVVAVDDNSLAVAPAPITDPNETARALHNGRIGGEIGRAAMALAALFPFLLWITGFVNWVWPARRTKAAQNRRI